jgi:hypothetical protein
MDIVRPMHVTSGQPATLADRHVGSADMLSCWNMCSPRLLALSSTCDVMFEIHDYLISRPIGCYRHVHK